MSKFNDYLGSVLGEQMYNAGWGSKGRGFNPVSKQPIAADTTQSVGPILGGNTSTPSKMSGSVSAVKPAQTTAPQQTSQATAQPGSPETALNDIYAMLDAARFNKWNDVKQILAKYEGTAPEGYLPEPGMNSLNPQVRKALPVDQAARDAELAAKGYQKIGPGGTRTERDGTVRRNSKLGGVAGSLSNFLGDVGNTLKRKV